MVIETARPAEVWAAGDAYEPYVGRWSRLVAREFLAWLDQPADREWLDVGCGTGVLTHEILSHYDSHQVRAIDSSEGFVAYARAHVVSPRIVFEVGDAQNLPVASSTFDAVVSGLVLNFVPDHARMVVEMMRAARPESMVALYVWDYAGKMEMMRIFWDAARALDPAAATLDEGVRFPVCAPEPLRKFFTQAGLRDIEVRTIDVPTQFRDFDDYWTPFLGGQAPAPGYCMSLTADRRAALRERIRASLPIAADGSIALTARAWAVQGVRRSA